jgi:hypothetical protein
MPITSRSKGIAGFFVCPGLMLEIDILFISDITGNFLCIRNKIFIPVQVSWRPGKKWGNTNQWGEIPRFLSNQVVINLNPIANDVLKKFKGAKKD